MSATEHGLNMKRNRKQGQTIHMVNDGYKKFMARHGMPVDPYRPRKRRKGRND